MTDQPEENTSMTALTSQTNTPDTLNTATDMAATIVAAAPAPQAAPGVGTGAGLLIVVILGFLLWRSIEKKRAKPVHVIMAFTMGVLLAGSMIGVMAKQTADSIGGGVQTMFSTVTNGGGYAPPPAYAPAENGSGKGDK